MRRDYFTITFDGIDPAASQDMPTMAIEFEGPTAALTERLETPSGDRLTAEETDVAFRLQPERDDDPETGVISVTNRITGDFVLELNADVDTVFEFIQAARRYGQESGTDDGKFRVRLVVEGSDLVAYEKTTWLVYDGEGNLLRQRSLIPSGVEL